MIAPLIAAAAALALSPSPVGRGQVSLVSWNILAPSYAEPTKYPWANDDALAWPNRRSRIIDALRSMDADAVCLQEVERVEWGAMETPLSAIGYDSVVQTPKQSGTRPEHPVCNVVLLRRGRLRCVRSESRSRAQIVVVEAADVPRGASTTPPLYLANVHLEAGNDKGAQRLFQLRKLLRRIELQVATDADPAERGRGLPSQQGGIGAAAARRAPVVLAGDFNFDRRSPQYTLLSKGEEGGGAPRGGTEITPANPLLPLTDAYAARPPPWGPPLRSSYRNGRLLDFVWTSDAVGILRTMPVAPMAGSTHAHRLPSTRHPSDHLPVGALLRWAGAPAPLPERCAWQQLFVESVAQAE